MSSFLRARKGFTLVELLVVVAIIALLVSILLPALGEARYQTKLVICATRQRTILQAVNIYTSDYGKLPPSVQGQASPRYPAVATYWTFPNRLKYYYGDSLALNGGSVIEILGEYMESAENFSCPVTNDQVRWQEDFIRRSNDDAVGVVDGSYFLLWNYMKFENNGFRPTNSGDTLMTSDFMIAEDSYNRAIYGDSWITTHKFKGARTGKLQGKDELYPAEERITIYAGPNINNIFPDVDLNVGYLDGRIERVNVEDDFESMAGSLILLPKNKR